MSNHSFDFKSINKDRLFHNCYHYCLSFHLDEVNCLRNLDHGQIDDFINRRRTWREIAQQRWNQSPHKNNLVLGRRSKEITEKTVEDLHVLAEALLTTQHEFKLVVTVDQGYVYTNSMELLDQLDQLSQLTHKTYSQVHINRPRDTVKLKNPQHRFRSYFKTMCLSHSQKQNLTDFLQNQRPQIRISPALGHWLDDPFNRCQDYFFVDYNNHTWTTMLSLVVPGIIRKTLHIVGAK